MKLVCSSWCSRCHSSGEELDVRQLRVDQLNQAPHQRGDQSLGGTQACQARVADHQPSDPAGGGQETRRDRLPQDPNVGRQPAADRQVKKMKNLSVCSDCRFIELFLSLCNPEDDCFDETGAGCWEFFRAYITTVNVYFDFQLSVLVKLMWAQR